jgi:hypothetical protein
MEREDEVYRFANELYSKLIEAMNQKDSPFALLMQDNATYSQYPGITSANLRNILIGGKITGSATTDELIMARVEFEASCCKVSHSILDIQSTEDISAYTIAPKYDVETVIIPRLQVSTNIITQRIWSEEVQKKYIMKSHGTPSGMLQKTVIRSLFGVHRKERVAIFELQLPLEVRVRLLNECKIKIGSY